MKRLAALSVLVCLLSPACSDQPPGSAVEHRFLPGRRSVLVEKRQCAEAGDSFLKKMLPDRAMTLRGETFGYSKSLDSCVCAYVQRDDTGTQAHYVYDVYSYRLIAVYMTLPDGSKSLSSLSAEDFRVRFREHFGMQPEWP